MSAHKIGGIVVDMPEHDKMNAWTREERALLESFLDHLLDTQGWELCELRGPLAEYWPVRKSRGDIMASFYGIDPIAFSNEKDRLVKTLQNDNSARELIDRYTALDDRGRTT